MRKTVDPKVKKRCGVLALVQYSDKSLRPHTKSFKYRNYIALKHRVGNSFLDRQWGLFYIRELTPVEYGPELPT